ncbi:hypothetical protein LK540_22125 [Massilia sp. IC2-278]|uniref:hypothetical protein n=1 Tax=Massilia sp. IC2-278 TaxID=2887200 RepID=UPI001E480FE8|nr:hypothetical protein [Massilia sp. IC2-278]MCC2963136.1 hypothetical protein [Massilia sp. IC2-278]
MRSIPVLLVATALAAAACSDASDTSEAIGRLIRTDKPAELRLADATRFAWDRVFIFEPYTSRARACGVLGVKDGDCERIVPFESMDDGEMSLAFLAQGRVVRYVRHSRANGDFVPVPANQPLARDDAVFRIVPFETLANGRTLLRLVKK